MKFVMTLNREELDAAIRTYAEPCLDRAFQVEDVGLQVLEGKCVGAVLTVSDEEQNEEQG